MVAVGTVRADRLERVLALLRANGGRVTSPRRAILEALIGHGEHPTAEQLTAAVQARQPDVHESTVYRFLDDLERLGVVDHVHLGHGPAVYHFSDDTHHHLVCQTCGRVVEVGWLIEELRVSLFAQVLGTSGPVSVPRITRELARLEADVAR